MGRAHILIIVAVSWLHLDVRGDTGVGAGPRDISELMFGARDTVEDKKDSKIAPKNALSQAQPEASTLIQLETVPSAAGQASHAHEVEVRLLPVTEPAHEVSKAPRSDPILPQVADTTQRAAAPTPPASLYAENARLRVENAQLRENAHLRAENAQLHALLNKKLNQQRQPQLQSKPQLQQPMQPVLLQMRQKPQAALRASAWPQVQQQVAGQSPQFLPSATQSAPLATTAITNLGNTFATSWGTMGTTAPQSRLPGTNSFAPAMRFQQVNAGAATQGQAQSQSQAQQTMALNQLLQQAQQQNQRGIDPVKFPNDPYIQALGQANMAQMNLGPHPMNSAYNPLLATGQTPQAFGPETNIMGTSVTPTQYPGYNPLGALGASATISQNSPAASAMSFGMPGNIRLPPVPPPVPPRPSMGTPPPPISQVTNTPDILPAPVPPVEPLDARFGVRRFPSQYDAGVGLPAGTEPKVNHRGGTLPVQMLIPGYSQTMATPSQPLSRLATMRPDVRATPL